MEDYELRAPTGKWRASNEMVEKSSLMVESRAPYSKRRGSHLGPRLRPQ